ncbi:MAG TPA: DUF933 domain-containing protein, partial [Candidatus Omnitrophota bacterium]|nr:DUF933 domain-containing protein [Candidatus Omnitrophota bacterium]
AKTGDKAMIKELAVLEKLKEALEKGKPAREAGLTEDEKPVIKELALLTLKPVLYVANVDDSGNPDKVAAVENIAKSEGSQMVVISSKLEAEIAELSDEDAKSFLAEMGLKESALNKLIHGGYKLLNLITFFTAGEKESRAWTITSGTKAPQAAGKIHSDMERGFIAAEVVHYPDMIACGGYSAARDKGLIHTEGKNYEFQDGDIVIIRFNV